MGLPCFQSFYGVNNCSPKLLRYILLLEKKALAEM